jgi:hypothetical protein
MPKREQKIILFEETDRPLVVSWSFFNDEWALDLRHYYYDDSGVMRPTKRGARILAANVPEVMATINAVVPDEMAQYLAEDGNEDEIPF